MSRHSSGRLPTSAHPTGSGTANGYRVRPFDSRMGALELAIPKTRTGSYFPDWLAEPRRRAERALVAVIQEAYVKGVSTRKVDDLVRAMGASGVSKSEVSRLVGELDADLAAFRERGLAGVRYPCVWLDAQYEKVRESGRVQNTAFLVAIAVNERSEREVIGSAVVGAESEASWTGSLRSLVARGLVVRLAISDAHLGVKVADAATLEGAAWQRSSVHSEPGPDRSPSRTRAESLGSGDRLRSSGRPAPPLGRRAYTGPQEDVPRAPTMSVPGGLRRLARIVVSADGWAAIQLDATDNRAFDTSAVMVLDLVVDGGASGAIAGGGPSWLPDGTLLLSEQVLVGKAYREVARRIPDHGFGEPTDLVINDQPPAWSSGYPALPACPGYYIVEADGSGLRGYVFGGKAEPEQAVTLRWDGSVVGRDPADLPCSRSGRSVRWEARARALSAARTGHVPGGGSVPTAA